MKIGKIENTKLKMILETAKEVKRYKVKISKTEDEIGVMVDAEILLADLCDLDTISELIKYYRNGHRISKPKKKAVEEKAA